MEILDNKNQDVAKSFTADRGNCRIVNSHRSLNRDAYDKMELLPAISKVEFFSEQMEPEYSSDIVSESLSVACISASEFVQPFDLAKDPDNRWVSQSYEIMHE